uniref:Uncharacterized protein n=1 Tax=Oryza sativa subsp. japonica TaxID=39947 RepID=Q9FW72_ORYSJ|nr:hypothetical protein [Oryza sativa Japonica Group]
MSTHKQRGAAARAVTAVRTELRRRLPVPHVATTSSRPATVLSLLRARGQCGSLLHPRRLCFSIAPVAAAKPEAVGTTGEAAAAPVEELAKSLQGVQGVEVFDLRGKAVPAVDLWKDRNFLSFHLQKHKMFSYSTFAAPPPSQQLRTAAAAIAGLADPCRCRQWS